VIEAVRVERMRCSYHNKNASVVACSRCARALCQACDHRIRGFPYCQDCIVAGVELLQQQPALLAAPQLVRSRTSPWIAGLLSFIFPGLGAAYNGQTTKSVVHFAIFASCLQMAAATDATVWFLLASLGIWLYAAVDSFRTAQLIRAGLSPDSDSDPIVRRLYGHPLAWAVLLIVLGTIFLLYNMLGVQLPVRQTLPVVLVLLGGYMLFDYLRRARRARELSFDNMPPPASAVGPLDMTAFRTGDLAAAQGARKHDWPPRV
jgi:hypothetical protein